MLHRFLSVGDKLDPAQNWEIDLPAFFADAVKAPGCLIAPAMKFLGFLAIRR